MAWVKGIISGSIDGGRITATTRDLEVMESRKPANPDEAHAAGLTLLATDFFQARMNGDFSFTAHFGGATAVLVPWEAVTKLDARRMGHLEAKFFADRGFPEWVAVMHVRNLGAPAVQSAAEPSGGMAETANLALERVKEIVEIGVMNDGGRWVQVMLPTALSEHQALFDAEQQRMRALRHDACDWATVATASTELEFMEAGSDTLNGFKGIVTAGPVGDVALTCVAQLHLSGTGHRFVDMETHNGVPMRRRMVAIAPRQRRSPVVIVLDAEGKIDDFGLHFVLDGENRAGALSHIGTAVLDTLGWFPKKGVSS